MDEFPAPSGSVAAGRFDDLKLGWSAFRDTLPGLNHGTRFTITFNPASRDPYRGTTDLAPTR